MNNLSEEEKKAIEELKSFINDKACIYWIGKNGEETVVTRKCNQQRQNKSKNRRI